MSMNPDELNNFAKSLSNSASGPMPKKKSAAAIQRAKAKGLKGAAAIALGQPAGKKDKGTKGNNSSNKNNSGKGKDTNTKSVPAPKSFNVGGYIMTPAKKTNPAVSSKTTPASSAATPGFDARALQQAARIALGNPSVKQWNMERIKRNATQAAAIALGNPMKAQPKTAPKKK